MNKRDRSIDKPQDEVTNLSKEFGSGQDSKRVVSSSSGGSSIKPKKIAFDKDEHIPEGYDHTIWSLAKHFERRTEKEGFGLAASTPIIYAEIKPRYESLKFKEDGTANNFTPDVYHEFVVAMMEYYWRYVADLDNARYSYQEFTRLDVWNYLREAINAIRLGNRVREQAEEEAKATPKKTIPSSPYQRKKNIKPWKPIVATKLPPADPNVWEKMKERVRVYEDEFGPLNKQSDSE